ncbi:hypothetical protein COT97_02605 [Candidatus Falkowbacteria bacterium CG10_big_fil_rev_8_21_14_0_10_39_11]|uniref:Uncharacterized protein n=1 Tax=Candidatus Falkowbacteria bacterium CG10_big_fil_rev_8_21_14_0_10_39_11 TaxID=1974565 RepID=A0A2H0V521_9BACT|nr:MAG: hypothetical protein COT97_02605 [Candidatus Falkowbacteria bacterium CG10_big_fil_rev_8_21_14_0_10_39_11]
MIEKYQAYIVYLPLVIVILLGVLIWRNWSANFTWKRMNESVRKQERVNLSPDTNIRTAFIVIVIFLLVIGMFWSGISRILMLQFVFGILMVYLLLELFYRRIKDEGDKVIRVLLVFVVGVGLLIYSLWHGFGTVDDVEINVALVEVEMDVSNDSYVDSKIQTNNEEFFVEGDVYLISPQGDEVFIGTVGDYTTRDQADDGWTHFSFDISQYVTPNVPLEAGILQIRYYDGQGCLHVRNVVARMNIIKGYYLSTPDLDAQVLCVDDKDTRYLEYKIDLDTHDAILVD